MTFDQWWDKEVAKMKKGERNYFAERIFPGDLKRAWDAATKEAAKTVKRKQKE